MNLKTIAIAFALGGAVMASAAADKVVGYFPYWCQYSQFFPKDIRYNLVTNIHYASLAPSSDGSIAFTDENDAENFAELSKLSKENNVSLIVSIGGMEMEGALQEIGASEEVRGTFAQNVSSWLSENGAQGVEIDWQNFTSENAEAFGNLVSALKDALGSSYSVTATVYPLSAADAYNADDLNKLDYVTVFVPDQMTEEESSLKPNQSVEVFEQALSAMASKGVSKDKLIPVVSMYGKSFTGATGLGTSQTGVGSGNEGYINYKDLMKIFEKPDYKVSFDESSKSEVAVSDMESIVFMGIPSVKALSENVKSEGYSGVAVYDLSQDHNEPIISLLVTIGLELRPGIDYKAKKK